MIAVFAGALALFKSRQYHSAAASVLLVLVCAEMLGQSVSSMYYLNDDVVYTTRTSYFKNIDKYEDSVDFVLENDDGFYRFDRTNHSLINTPMMFGIRGFSNSTSTLNRDTIDFLRFMGFSSKSHWSKYYGSTPVADSLLAAKYVIATNNFDVPDGYELLFEGSNTKVYQNHDALSVAYAVNENVKDIHLGYPKDYSKGLESGKYEEFTAYYTPPKRMNVLIGAMLGMDEDANVFVPIEDVSEGDGNITYTPVSGNHAKYTPTASGQTAFLKYSFTAPSSAEFYMYIPTNYPREASVLVNGIDKGTVGGNETDRMIALDTFEKSAEITGIVKLQTVSDNITGTCMNYGTYTIYINM